MRRYETESVIGVYQKSQIPFVENIVNKLPLVHRNFLNHIKIKWTPKLYWTIGNPK